ncbi:MAG: TMEM165/GDT1 family protein [Candidatus Omnitrophica bacterium]|nr:TMEM165/GDT1 family protein [Candidatus Omnitrophota bacterium]
MDLRLIATTFTTLFLAELGDKTQLAVLSLTASSRQPLAVFVGAALALLAVTAIGVLVGEGVSRIVPPWLIQKAAAFAFIAIGVLLLLGKTA